MSTTPASDVDLIAEFLRKHPAIFEQHPELLDHIKLSDPRGISSLLERQITRLQDRIEHVSAHHHTLVGIAMDNERILGKLDAILSELLTYRHLSEFVADFPRKVREAFKLDQVTIKTEQSVSGKPSDKLNYKEAVRRLGSKRAVCDDRWPTAITNLFFAAPMASSALVPLLSRDEDTIIGVIALGSSDPERFAPELGTAHLDRIGVLAGLCYERLMMDET